MKPLVKSCLLTLSLAAVLLSNTGCSPPALFENEYGPILAAIDSDAAIPTGMRLTKNGWEDTSQWNISLDFQDKSIESWIENQRQREPGWVRRSFAKIRTTPPLMFAVIQIAMIAAIVHVGKKPHDEQTR
ncbi:MAG: hypothetical protein KDB00_26940 [Planctomycetales bacterium]|nr:hypothetical protein [Planctomycetales bacterium]